MRSFPRWILALGALALTLVPTISTASPASVADLDALARAAAREPLERAAAFRASLRPLAPLNATGGGVPPDPSSDALWWGGFGLSEFDGPVYAMTEYHGELIVCGLFLQAGGVPAYHIARWNGQSWAPLAEGVSCEPQALQVVGDRLYVGGIDADGTLAQRNMIFAWDGASWTNVSANLSDGLVWSLTEYQGDLVAGGLFVRDEAPGVYLGVVRWDGAAWSPVGAAAPRNAHALIADGTTLYAGGYFEDGYSVTNGAAVVMRFNGSVWDTLARADGLAGNPYVVALAIDGGDLVAGGTFQSIGGVTAPNVARFHLGGWQSMRGGTNNFVSSLRNSSTGLLVGGDFWEVGGNPTYCVARWTGSTWETFSGGLYFGTRALIEYGGRVIAGGDFDQSGDLAVGGGRLLSHIAKWDGVSWSAMKGTTPNGAGVLGSPANEIRVLETLNGSLYAGGSFLFPGDPPYSAPQRGVARWTGVAWELIGDQVFSGPVFAITSYHGDLIVGGLFSMGYQSTGISNIARWTGSGWEPLGTGTNGPVYALAVYGDELYAAGEFGLAGNLLCSGIAHWDGTRWLPAGPPTTPGGNPLITSLELFGGDLIAGGFIHAIGSLAAKNVARWDGTSWSAMGNALDGGVNTLEVHQGELYAGTSFGGLGLARWDGAEWTPVAGASGFNVERLRSIGEELFVGGYLRDENGDPAGSIARWSGGVWSALGSGVTTSTAWPRVVYGLAEFQNSLFVGGTFTMAGGKSAWHMARWDGLPVPPVPPAQPLAIAPARPNPFTGSTTVSFGLPSSGDVTITVLDLTGRKVRTLWNGPMVQGARSITWDGRLDDGTSAIPGLYFIRVRAAAGSITARAVKLGR